MQTYTPEYIAACEASRARFPGPFWIWSKAEIMEMASSPSDWDFDHWVGYLNADGYLELHCFTADGSLCSNVGFPRCLYPQSHVINRLPAAMRPALSKDAIRYGMDNTAKVGYVRLYDIWKRKSTTMRNGRAVKFLCPELNDEEVKNLAAEIRSTQVELELSFTRDPYEVQEAYKNGPHSCMSHEFDYLYDGNGEQVHPSNVYWHPENDLALAVVRAGDRVLGRCIVRTCEKVFYGYAIYASNDYVSGMDEVMERMLQEAGYESVRDERWLEGVKLLRIDCNGGIVCPYLDPSNRCVEVHEDHLLVTEYGDHQVTHSNACLKDYPPGHAAVCNRCDSVGHYDRFYNLNTDEHVHLCGSCISYEYYTATCAENGTEGICSSAYVELIDGDIMYIGNGWGEVVHICSGTSAGEYAMFEDVIECQVTGDKYSSDDDTIYVDSDGKVWLKRRTVLVDGDFCCRDEVDYDLYEDITGEHADYDSDYEDIPQYVYKEQSIEEAS